ncbi:signal transduction histidine kinase [Herbinix hemicellulosilytica]|uniref:histidine kinase n=1 Tax=Herbinix hemicellulosilytica TaxID=1564487 RepID=A0A0H5SG14_HERHM|nr:histidine kinase [Herbinix hemicellulosilytica]RBP60722.1 signal transduction histidine kinase [Herbinix hemicellulosilytica]CRZ34409.1 hypothetical protein HHT355_1207 [Herbinix hemicellulosilytica]
MLDLPVLYLIAKTAAVTASYLAESRAKTDVVASIISVLSFCCIFVFELLLERLFKRQTLIYISVIFSLIACFLIGIEFLMPLATVLLMHLIDLTVSGKMYYRVLAVVICLLLLIYPPGMDGIILTALLILTVILVRAVLKKLNEYIHKNEMLKEEIMRLENKISDLKNMMKNIKTAVSLEERNRIAARIHDEIGHGISGSIILLEAAMLQMKNGQDKALGSIEKAVKNLRESVDEIRTALKEERTDRYLIDIHDISAILDDFKVKYNISTRLMTSGDLSNIGPQIWVCIHDNLKECLTNVLKHSNATEFVLNIQVFNKIIKVEYKDNGKTGKSFEKHLGLEAIEERTANAKGRCFITKDENGFCVTNIFYY